MRKAWLALAILSMTALVFAGCSKNNPTAPSAIPEQGNIMFALDAASDNIASGTVTITKGHITQVLPITIAGYTGTVAFNGVQVGHWNIQVRLFDTEGVEIYSGDGSAVVSKNGTTHVTIRVQHNTGNLSITVEVPGAFPPELVAYWTFDEGTGTTSHDLISGIPANLFGPTWTAGIAGSALSYDAIGEYTLVPDAPGLNPAVQITCEEWIKLTSSAPAWGTALIEKGGWNGGQTGYCFLVGNWGMENTVRFEVFSPWRLLDSVTPLPLNQWSHIVATYDGSSMKLYINGQLNSSAAVSGGINAGNTSILGMGERFYSTGVNPNELVQAFPGAMDEVAIYSRALTPAEIQQHYNNGLQGKGYFAGN